MDTLSKHEYRIREIIGTDGALEIDDREAKLLEEVIVKVWERLEALNSITLELLKRV